MAHIMAQHRDEVYGDPGVHALSVLYFENLKNGPHAHRACMDLLTSRAPLDDRGKHICLGVIADYVRNSYEEGPTIEAHEEMRNFLVRYGEVRLVSRRVVRLEDLPVRALAADIFGRVGLTDYPLRWPGFFAAIIAIGDSGPKGGDHFLRTLRRLHHIITTQSMPEEEFDRIFEVVQKMQDVDFPRVLESVCRLMAGKGSVVKECLAVLNAWVTLIDDVVFMRHPIINLVLDAIEIRPTQKHALIFLMALMKKVKITDTEHCFFMGRVFQQLVEIGMDSPDETRERITTRFGALLRETGCRMLEILMQVEEADLAVVDEEFLVNLHQCFDGVVAYLDSKSISVSSSVIPFAVNYLGLFQKRKKLSLDEYNHCIQLLEIVLAKIKARPSQSFRDESKNETFSNYRKAMVQLFEEIASVKRKVVFKAVHSMILKHLVKKDWCNEPFHVAEYPIFLLNLLCFTYRAASTKAIRVLMRALMNSDIISHPHSAVNIQFYQAVAKNVGFFRSEPKYIPRIISSFKEGLTDPSPRGRCVAAEQLLLFVRGVGTLPTATYTELLRAVRDTALVLGTFKEVPQLMDQDHRVRLSLVEVAGVAVARGKFSKQRKQHMVAEIIVPAMHLYHNASETWGAGFDRDACAGNISRAVDVVASLARAFDARAAAASGCDDVFVDTVTILDHCEHSQLLRGNVQASVTQLVFQLASCLEDRFLPFLPKMLRGLLYCRRDENVMEVAKLLTFVIDKYKRKIFYFLKQEFTHISGYIHDSLTHSSLHGDREKGLESRQRLYLSFVMSLLEHGMLMGILAGLDEKEVGMTIAKIFSSTVEGPRGKGRVRGLVALNHIVEKWPTGGERHGNPGAVRAIFNYLVMGSFLVMQDAFGHLQESHADFLDTFEQCAQLFKKVHRRRGGEFVTWLVQDYLPQTGVNQRLIKQVVEILIGDHNVELENFLKSLFLESLSIHIPPCAPLAIMN